MQIKTIIIATIGSATVASAAYGPAPLPPTASETSYSTTEVSSGTVAAPTEAPDYYATTTSSPEATPSYATETTSNNNEDYDLASIECEEEEDDTSPVTVPADYGVSTTAAPPVASNNAETTPYAKVEKEASVKDYEATAVVANAAETPCPSTEADAQVSPASTTDYDATVANAAETPCPSTEDGVAAEQGTKVYTNAPEASNVAGEVDVLTPCPTSPGGGSAPVDNNAAETRVASGSAPVAATAEGTQYVLGVEYATGAAPSSKFAIGLISTVLPIILYVVQ